MIKLGEFIALSGAVLKNNPKISAFDKISIHARDILRGNGFVYNGRQEDLDLALKNGAYVIFYEGDTKINVNDDEVALLHSDNLEWTLLKYLRFCFSNVRSRLIALPCPYFYIARDLPSDIHFAADIYELFNLRKKEIVIANERIFKDLFNSLQDKSEYNTYLDFFSNFLGLELERPNMTYREDDFHFLRESDFQLKFIYRNNLFDFKIPIIFKKHLLSLISFFDPSKQLGAQEDETNNADSKSNNSALKIASLYPTFYNKRFIYVFQDRELFDQVIPYFNNKNSFKILDLKEEDSIELLIQDIVENPYCFLIFDSNSRLHLENTLRLYKKGEKEINRSIFD